MQRNNKTRTWRKLAEQRFSRLGALSLAALMAVGFGSSVSQAGTVSDMCQYGTPSGGGVTFNLKTATGFIETPDGNSVFMWGYAPASDNFQMPGPVLCVTQGQTVNVHFINTVLSEPASIVFPGQAKVTASGGAAGLFTNETGGSAGPVPAIYSFVAGEPGTYLYESGTNPQKQVHMGLYGALVVRPTAGPNFAYNDAATQFDLTREYLIVIHDMDPFLHLAVERGEIYDVTAKHDRYWTINGRSFPDTIQDDNVPWLAGQPYNAFVSLQAVPCDPDILDNTGAGCLADPDSPNYQPALIRYINAGMANHPFHPHGNHLRVIARDGRLLDDPLNPDSLDHSMEAFTKTIGSGQTYDLLIRWVNEQNFSSAGNPLPLALPGPQNLVFKDGLTYYSGSPYLGEQGVVGIDFPAATTVLNDCGEFYYPWHSHALNEFQNFNEGFGGLATLWRVEPSAGCAP